MDMKQYVREKGSGCFCPIEDGFVYVGLNYFDTRPPQNGEVIGEFYYDAAGEVIVKYYDKDGDSTNNYINTTTNKGTKL